MGERISGTEDRIEEMDGSVKENVNSKHPGNLGHYEKTKSKNNRNRGRRRNPDQRHKSFQQNWKRFP